MVKKLIASFLLGTLLASLMGCDSSRVASITPDMERAATIRQAFGAAGGALDEEGDASAQQPTGWATLRGTFLFDGPPPSRDPLTLAASKDAEVCAPGGNLPLAEQLVVASNGGIKDVVIYLDSEIDATEPWTHPEAQPGKTDEIIFDQKACIFLSHVVGMQSTQALRILNSDPMGHNTNIQPTSNAAFNQNIPAGGFAIFQPTRQENSPVPVACSVHPWMNANLLIRDNSYWAITKEDGSFEIPNLPAGVELEFRVWQESAGFLQEVTVNGQDVKWSKGRFTLTLDPQDESSNQLQVSIKPNVF